MNKQMMVEALYRFINQRSGIDYRNYAGGDWKASREAFNGDYRPMLKHGRHARQMLREVELRESVTAEMLVEASRAFSGRLQFVERYKNTAGEKCSDCGAKPGALHKTDCKGGQHGLSDAEVLIDYTTGQYFPTEYRKAACAVLAQALWDYWRPDHKTGDEIAKRARRELGRGIAADWFN